MGTSADWQASSVQVAGLMKQVHARGLAEQVLAKCSDDTRRAFTSPYSTRWHSGTVLVEFSEAIVAVAGSKTFGDMNYDMTRASFGPILGPMLQVALAITGRTPATLLARMPQAIESALKNVQVTWESTGATSGTLRFVYPCDIRPDTLHAWLGALRFIEELSGTTLRFEEQRVEIDRITLRIAW